MSDEKKPKPEEVENLELNRETIQDLTESDAEAVRGGVAAHCTGKKHGGSGCVPE